MACPRTAQDDRVLRLSTWLASLGCHPERSEGSVSLGTEMLRGVYTERSEGAQHDRAVPSRRTLARRESSPVLAVLYPRPAPFYDILGERF
jgi:hypothetical protein